MAKLNLAAVKDYVQARAAEPSTWRGVVRVAGAMGLIADPSQWLLIITIVFGTDGTIGALTKDRTPAPGDGA